MKSLDFGRYVSSCCAAAAMLAGCGGSTTHSVPLAGQQDAPRMITRGTSSCPCLYVANTKNSSITVYASGADGNASPVAVIMGSSTRLSAPYGVAEDSSGFIYVANNGNNTITIYRPRANGNVAPYKVIAGSKTGLDEPHGIVIR